MLKQSREFYLNAESSPVQVEPMRQRQKHQKGHFPEAPHSAGASSSSDLSNFKQHSAGGHSSEGGAAHR